MADKGGQDRTEKPTQKRREEAVEKGNVSKSAELNSAIILLAGLMVFKFIKDVFGDTLTQFVIRTYHEISFIDITVTSFPLQVLYIVKIAVALTAPFLLTLLVAGLVVNYAQVGFIFAKKALVPKFDKLNPFSGIKRIFSARSLVELLKGLLKLTIISWIVYSVIMSREDQYIILAHQPITKTMTFLVEMLTSITIKVGFALLVMAAADYAYQRWEYERGLKMTKEEVKDERKNSEGNPQIKNHIRSLQLQRARDRMMQAVPEATVVVTNPTFIAIALKYDPQSGSDAPKILAKGKRKIAEKIKEIAAGNNIPIFENKPLARSLFANCEVGQEIPAVYYQAVAELIARIYQQQAS